MLSELHREGAESENVTFVIPDAEEDQPGWLGGGVAGFTAGWALALAQLHHDLRLDEALVRVLAAPLIAAWLAHLLGLAMAGPGPITEWTADAKGQFVRWVRTRRVGLLRRRKVKRVPGAEVALHWALHDGSVEAKVEFPEGSIQLELLEVDAERLAQRAARALRHAPPTRDETGWSSQGARALLRLSRADQAPTPAEQTREPEQLSAPPVPPRPGPSPSPPALSEQLDVKLPTSRRGIAASLAVALGPIAVLIGLSTLLPFLVTESLPFELAVAFSILLAILGGAVVAERSFASTLSLDFVGQQARVIGRGAKKFPFADITQINVETRQLRSPYVESEVVMITRFGRFVIRHATAELDRKKSLERALDVYARQLRNAVGLKMKPL